MTVLSVVTHALVSLPAAVGDPEVLTIPGFDFAGYAASLGLTAGTWFGIALTVGLGAGVISTIALIAVGRLKRALSK